MKDWSEVAVDMASDKMMADEEDFIDLIIANDRLEGLMAAIKTNTDGIKRRQAIVELITSVKGRLAYQEQARELGVADLLTALVQEYSQEYAACCDAVAEGDRGPGVSVAQLLDGLAEGLAVCSGIAAQKPQVHTVQAGAHEVRIQEGCLADGLGAKVWPLSHACTAVLAANAPLLAGKRVLELGSGCGVCGIAAAKLGPSEVVLTDHDPRVLEYLGRNVVANAGVGSTAAHAQGGSSAARQQWRAGNMAVRYCDWEDSFRALVASAPRSCRDSPPHAREHAIPPGLGLAERFDVVIGVEVMYEREHALFVAAAVRNFLADQGLCIIMCAVRDVDVFATFEQEVRAYGSAFAKWDVALSQLGEGSSLGRVGEYEGGLVLYAVCHQDRQLEGYCG